jgi:hypothetical protein
LVRVSTLCGGTGGHDADAVDVIVIGEHARVEDKLELDEGL